MSIYDISMEDQQEVFHIVNTIIYQAQRSKSILEVMFEFVKIELAVFDSKLC